MDMKEHTILLVEDDSDDVLLIKRAFEQAKIANPIQEIGDGESAIRYLDGEPPYDDRSRYPLPVIILLDLKMPRRSGFEVLEWMRDQEMIRRIPVVVLTGSKESKDVEKAYDLGANSYLVKPVSFEDLSYMVETLKMYWLILNESWILGEEG